MPSTLLKDANKWKEAENCPYFKKRGREWPKIFLKDCLFCELSFISLLFRYKIVPLCLYFGYEKEPTYPERFYCLRLNWCHLPTYLGSLSYVMPSHPLTKKVMKFFSHKVFYTLIFIFMPSCFGETAMTRTTQRNFEFLKDFFSFPRQRETERLIGSGVH